MSDRTHNRALKDRTFVRAVNGEYNLTEELRKLRERPRVLKGSEIEFYGGPQHFNKDYLQPKDGLGQTLHIHLEEFSPGGTTQKHGHVNEAVFYILDGEGVEVHDGKSYDWKAGEIVIVHNNCVHQHFNRSATKPARALVMKTKPMYIFMNMLFQKLIEASPSTETEHSVGFEPRLDHEHEADHDHDHDHAHMHEPHR
ncbi:MAG TPA: cupin domain-containing protein [Candidatus Acidoferrales bacterium]|nr:cupin domain-containing protein [Candidatus Acidoferrales bacterium]